MATELSKAEWLEFHAAACADALQRFPDAHPDVRQYLGLAVLGEYPTETPTELWDASIRYPALQCLICSALMNGYFFPSALRTYKYVLASQGIELPDELKAYYERARLKP